MRLALLFAVMLLAAPLTPVAFAQADGNAAPSQRVVAPSSDSGWRPTPEQEGAIEKTTKEYFALKDGNRHEEAYGRLSARQKQFIPSGAYVRMGREFNAAAGEVQGRQLRAVTWYKDAPQAGPGLYVAVDYSSQYANLALHCGYLIWHEQPDNSFLLVREEVNLIDKATMARLKPEDVARARSQFGC